MTAPNNISVRPAQLDRDDRPAVRRKPGELDKLTAKHLRMVSLMVWGGSAADVQALTRDGVPIEPGLALALGEAAQVVGIRQRGARELAALGIFQNELTREVHRLRTSEQPRAMAQLAALRDRVGAGKAADAKVQLAASLALLGDAAGPGKPSVNVNVGVNVQAGYVIDLRPDDGKPGRPTIEGGAGSIIVSNEEGFE